MSNKKTVKALQKVTRTKDISWLYDTDFINVYLGKKPKTQVEKQWNGFIKSSLTGGALDYNVLANDVHAVHDSVLEQIKETYAFLRNPIAYINAQHKKSMFAQMPLADYVNQKLKAFNLDFRNKQVINFFNIDERTWQQQMRNMIQDYIEGTSMHQTYIEPGTVEVNDTERLQESRMFNTALFFAPRLKTEYVVWRGLGLPISPEVNHEFSSPVAMSTSTRSAVSIEWMLERLGKSCCLLKITLPRGTPCLWVGKPPMNQETRNAKHISDMQLIQAEIDDMFEHDPANPIHFQYEVILPSGFLKVTKISSIDLRTVLSPMEKQRFGRYWYKELGSLINDGPPSTKKPFLNDFVNGREVRVYECEYTPRWAALTLEDGQERLTVKNLNKKH